MPMPPNVAGGELIFAAWGNNVVESLPPIGFLGMWPGATPPVNWRVCDGTAISRATFAALWALFQTSGSHTRFGLGDGSTTFNLPNYKGRYPIGNNQGGGFFAVGVGEVYGTKDSVVPSHQHGLENHTHSVDIWSGYQSDDHYHNFLGIDSASSGPGITTMVTSPFGSLVQSTSGASASHRHAVNGNTGWATGHNTLWAGADGTNLNLPPSMSINFIIRVS